MRPTRPMPGTCAAALLAFLCAAGLPALAADRPDTPPPVMPPPEVEAPSAEPAPPASAGLAAIPPETEELLLEAQRDPGALGPLSIGTPDSGLLLNPVPF